MKLGAADYIAKPFLPEDLLATVQRLLEGKRLREENRLLRRQVERTYAFGEIIGRSDAMQKVFENIRRVAATDFDVLIVGETGTGKELVARAIHQRSRRKEAPFVPVDCGAIPEQLMESEFFGHERGAFTGAQCRSLGLLEFANRGTFFMDEISQMPPRLQAKLLRVLQERKFRRVGSAKELELDLRIVAASSLDLESGIKQGSFRLDFFHRINVARIELPPLRARTEDIPLLVEHLLERYAREMEKPRAELGPEVLEVLTSYSWPGNIRELQNVLKRALSTTASGTIMADDLPDELVTRSGEVSMRQEDGFFRARERRLVAFEAEYLRNLLSGCHGDVSGAARLARLPRGTLYRLLKKHDLNPAEFRAVPVAAEGEGRAEA
jgi:two-component system response regulator PilR (NtrC family)